MLPFFLLAPMTAMDSGLKILSRLKTLILPAPYVLIVMYTCLEFSRDRNSMVE